jgi:hypothetical protein
MPFEGQARRKRRFDVPKIRQSSVVPPGGEVFRVRCEPSARDGKDLKRSVQFTTTRDQNFVDKRK